MSQALNFVSPGLDFVLQLLNLGIAATTKLSRPSATEQSLSLRGTRNFCRGLILDSLRAKIETFFWHPKGSLFPAGRLAILKQSTRDRFHKQFYLIAGPPFQNHFPDVSFSTFPRMAINQLDAQTKSQTNAPVILHYLESQVQAHKEAPAILNHKKTQTT